MKDLKERILEIIKENSATGTFAKGERSLMLTEPMYEHLSSKIESYIKENYVEKHNLTDAEIETEARQYAIHHSDAPDKDCPQWIITDFESGAKWARMKTIGVIQDLNDK